VRTLKNVEICDEVVMLDIIESDNECYGIVAYDKHENVTKKLYANYTVLACGGIGGVFDKSTNFRILTGDGVAICLKHGVAVDNINYIQIHPTTLYTGREGERSFLISESVRGEGAHLLDKNFERFTDELQPRDVVTAAIKKKMKEDGSKFVWLDMRPIPEEEVRSHFPGIVQRCANEGIDVFKECVPVVPAQHYFMGGIRSDLDGKTTMTRLFAVGETCCNGVHGANRLASNSLLESLLFAERAAYSIADSYTATDKKGEEYASTNVNLNDYKDYKKVLDGYKQMVLKGIEEAENVKPHNKCN
jgi:L-aspartate oxidase